MNVSGTMFFWKTDASFSRLRFLHAKIMNWFCQKYLFYRYFLANSNANTQFTREEALLLPCLHFAIRDFCVQTLIFTHKSLMQIRRQKLYLLPLAIKNTLGKINPYLLSKYVQVCAVKLG